MPGIAKHCIECGDVIEDNYMSFGRPKCRERLLICFPCLLAQHGRQRLEKSPANHQPESSDDKADGKQA